MVALSRPCPIVKPNDLRACLFPRMDNLPAPTTRVGTALRVRRFPTLHWCLRPDALRLPNTFKSSSKGEKIKTNPLVLSTAHNRLTAHVDSQGLVPPVFLTSQRLPEGVREGALGKASPYSMRVECCAFPTWSAVGRSVGRTRGHVAGVATQQPRSQVRPAPHPVAAG